MRDIKSSPLTKPIQVGVDSYMKSSFFCVPGAVKDFDHETQLASVQIGIMKQTEDGYKEHDILINVPVGFAGCDVVFGHSIKPGCEGMIHFSQRDSDAWINQGGVVEPITKRKFSMSDAFFTPNFRSIPNAIKNFKNDGAWIATENEFLHLQSDGMAHFVLKDLVIDSPETVINGHVTVNGNLDVTQRVKALTAEIATTLTAATINALTSLMVSGLNMLTHKHGGVSRGNETSDGPQ